MDGGIFLLLGSNMGDRLHHLNEAREKIGDVLAGSSVYATAAWGNKNQADFYNQVVEVGSKLDAVQLLEKIQQVELSMGRKRIEKWGPRIIDIDILLFRNEVVNTKQLTIPHPEIQNRRFTLVPLRELTNLVHPVLNKTIDQLLQECKDPLPVTRLQH